MTYVEKALALQNKINSALIIKEKSYSTIHFALAVIHI